MTDTTDQTRATRARAFLLQCDESSVSRIRLYDPPVRFLAVELDDLGQVEEAHQSETLKEMVELLEASRTIGTDTEIYDLDTEDVLRPDFERYCVVRRIYVGDHVAYQSSNNRSEPTRN